MVEEEFKANYVRSFLESYKSIVSRNLIVPKHLTKEELLQTAKDKAEIAWQTYLKNNAV